jgi:hypothetical protein
VFRPFLALPLALLVPLAAAAPAASGAFGSVEEFARAFGLKQGGWHTSLKIEAVAVEILPGADPAVAAEIKARSEAQVGSVKEIDECLGPPSETSLGLPGIPVEAECSFSRLEAGDGRWAIDATCPERERHGSARIVAQGTYSPGRVTGRHAADLSASGVIVHAKLETLSRFTGECLPPLVAPSRPEAD